MFIVKRNGWFDLSDFFDVPVLRNNKLLRTDVKEDDDKYVLEIDVPGFSKDELNISFDEGYLIVNGKKKTDDNVKYLRRERTANEVSRKYYFGEVNHEAISATFKDGVLIVTVPKQEPTVKNIIIE